MAKVTMPQLGESVAEGTIGRWLKKVGDPVAKYEPIVEVITDKVNAEVPSPFEGTLTQILVEEGQTVPNNAEIAVIEAAGAGAEAPAETPATPAGAAPAEPDSPQVALSAETAEEPATPAARSQERTFATTPQAGDRGVSPPAVGGNGVGTDDRTILGTGYGPAGSDERPAAEGTLAGPRPASGAPAPSSGVAVGTAAPTPAAPAGEPRAGEYKGPVTPAVRRLAREHGIDLALVAGTGHAGRVTREDVLRFVEQGGAQAAGQPSGVSTAAPPAPAASPAPAAAPPPAAQPPTAVAAPAPSLAPTAGTSPPPAPAAPAARGDELKAMTPMRRAIAAHMVRSKQTAPHAYTTVEVDMSGVVALREGVKAQYQAREGLALSYVAIVAKAVVEGLRRHPDLNAHWTEEGLVRKGAMNLGIAVAVDDGLVVPVIRDADGFSIHGLNLWVQDLAGRARANKLRLEDIQGGTFTLNNTGWFGSVASQPIINVPEVAILSMEAIVKRPVVIETPQGDTIGIRPMMNVCVSFDHRGTDGAQVGRFVQDVRRWLESADTSTPIW